jgi:hypothetical protein
MYVSWYAFKKLLYKTFAIDILHDISNAEKRNIDTSRCTTDMLHHIKVTPFIQ